MWKFLKKIAHSRNHRDQIKLKIKSANMQQPKPVSLYRLLTEALASKGLTDALIIKCCIDNQRANVAEVLQWLRENHNRDEKINRDRRVDIYFDDGSSMSLQNEEGYTGYYDEEYDGICYYFVHYPVVSCGVSELLGGSGDYKCPMEVLLKAADGITQYVSLNKVYAMVHGLADGVVSKEFMLNKVGPAVANAVKSSGKIQVKLADGLRMINYYEPGKFSEIYDVLKGVSMFSC